MPMQSPKSLGEKMEKKREAWLDTVKTIAIFIVLLNHANVILPGVNFWGGMFYVPVFFVLAGYTYRLKSEKYIKFIGSKAKRLLVPYFAANFFLLLFFSLKELLLDGKLVTVGINSIIGIFYARNQLFCMPGQEAILRVADYGQKQNIYFMNLQNAPTWFLPALFLSLIVFDGLMRIFKEDQKKIGITVACLLLVQLSYHYLCPILLPFSLDSIPFFVILIQAGYIAAKTDLMHCICTQKLYQAVMTGLSILFIITALLNGSMNLSVADYGNFMMIGLYNAVISSCLIMLLCYALEHCGAKSYLPRWLAAPGKCTLTILCYHLFVFMFLGSAITIACIMLGLSTNVYVVDCLKLLMIVFTIALFTRYSETLKKVTTLKEKR